MIQMATENANELQSTAAVNLLAPTSNDSRTSRTVEADILQDVKTASTLEHIKRLVGCLTKLAPTYSDRSSVHMYSYNAKPNDADEDVHLARILYPSATESLINRLGCANWRRRKYLQDLQEKRPRKSKGQVRFRNSRRLKRSLLRDVAVDAFNFQKPGHIEDDPGSSVRKKAEALSVREIPFSQPIVDGVQSIVAGAYPSRDAALHVFSSPTPEQTEAKPSTNTRPRSKARYFTHSETGSSSVMQSLFSRPTMYGFESTTGETSIIGIEGVFRPRTVPVPPVALENGRKFRCPYCHDELIVGINIGSKDDWDVHVFADLQPYTCTSENCLQAEKTFGNSDDWFRHELENHRTIKVWVCNSCTKEFASAPKFEEHLRNKHTNVCGPSQIAMMVALCSKRSEIRLEEEACPLCTAKLNAEAVQAHIANHFEQFALICIDTKESLEEDDGDNIQYEKANDIELVGQAKREMLDAFTKEQLGNLPEDTVIDESVLNFVLESHTGEIAEENEGDSAESTEGDDEDDDDEIQTTWFEDAMSVGKTKLEILNDFVEEQLDFLLPKRDIPADANMDQSMLDFVLDSDEDDSDESNILEYSRKRRGEETRDWKLGKYLDSHAGEKAGASDDHTRYSQSPQRKESDVRAPNFHLSDFPTAARAAQTTMRTQPRPRDEDFVGRDADLATMYRILSNAGRICTLCGTGGIGKTATAIEYHHRYQASYSYIFWIQAETQVGISDTFSLIALDLGLAPEGEDPKQLMELGRDFLEKTENRWLLIFDNVDDWKHIEAYIPSNMATSNGSVLIITRTTELEPQPIPTNYFRITLNEMPIEELQRLLIQSLHPSLKHERVYYHPEWKVAGEIANLSGLPLAVSQIAGYVRASGCTLAEFMELWTEWWKNNRSSRTNNAFWNPALEVIWDFGVNELGQDASKLLNILAFMNSEGIPKELLMIDSTLPGLRFLNSSAPSRYDLLRF
jgi:hypothetical protein